MFLPHLLEYLFQVSGLTRSSAIVRQQGFHHTSFSLLHEASLGSALTPGGNSLITEAHVPSGHLIRILMKGLLYLDAEARFRPVRPF
jgi:hypothetical protein